MSSPPDEGRGPDPDSPQSQLSDLSDYQSAQEGDLETPQPDPGSSPNPLPTPTTHQPSECASLQSSDGATRHVFEPYFDPKNDLNSFVVSFRNLSLSYMLNPHQSTNAILQFPLDVINNFRYHILRQRDAKYQFYRLAPTSGYFVQGECTLVLSPPGGGRTTLPKICAQALVPSAGDLFYNGVTAAEADSVYHIDAKKLVTFVEQVDHHFSELTVYETLEFAHRLLTPHPSRAYLMGLIEAFGMGECKDNLNSRISGGQGRRLSLMLGLCNPHIKFVAMDNLSDGLDHAVTLDIIAYLRKWCQMNKAVFVATLQQPAPSIFNLFDKLILLRDGHTIYHGPTAEVDCFIGAMGYPSNKDGLPLPEHIIHVLSHPKIAIQENALNAKNTKIEKSTKNGEKSLQNGQNDQNAHNQSTSLTPTSALPDLSKVPKHADPSRPSRGMVKMGRKEVWTSYGPMKVSLDPCIEVEEMLEFYQSSPFYAHIEEVLDRIEDARIKNGFGKTMGMEEREKAKEEREREGDQNEPSGQNGQNGTKNDQNGQNCEKNDNTSSSIPESRLDEDPNIPGSATGTNSTHPNDENPSDDDLINGGAQNNSNCVISNRAKNGQNGSKSGQNHKNGQKSQTDLSHILPSNSLPSLHTPTTSHFYRKGFTVSMYQLFCFVLGRQIKLTIRNHTQLIARILPAILISIVFAGLYFQLGLTDYSFRVASFIDVQTEVAYNNLIELGLFIYYRRLIHSQLNLYPTWIYTFSVFIAGIPYSLVEALVLTAIPYGMIGHSPYGWSIVTNYCMLWIHGLVSSSLFRLCASITANTGMAYAVVSPIISVFSLVAGFYVRADNLPKWLIWVYWISPFAWCLRSMSQLEFLSPRYDYIIDNPRDPGTMMRAGNVYLALLDIRSNPMWILLSVFFCIGVLALIMALSSWFLYAPDKEYSIGTRRFDLGENDDVVIESDDAQELDEFLVMHQFAETSQACGGSQSGAFVAGPDGGIEMSRLDLDVQNAQNGQNEQNGQNNTNQNPNSTQNSNKITSSTRSRAFSQSGMGPEPSRSRFAGGNNRLNALTNELPFTPVTLSFESIKFTVQAKDDQNQTYDRVLLQNITGYAQQGTLMALIGSSGAGKSTLANTLMGLNKTNSTQSTDGTIFINGHPVDGKNITHSQFTSLTAYVEQFDTLYPFDTVFETLLFSARSRLRDVTNDLLHRVVEEVMDVLELTQARDLIIGSPDNPVLSPAQIKRVNIGIELVANPSIIFLDEPTTGLDAEAAASVVRALHNIARSGRAIVCTIHQPSSQLFFHFDSLLLLGSGGFPLFFGRIGKWAKAMINYFNGVEGFEVFKGDTNPAEWLVEEVSKPLPDALKTKASVQFNNYQDSIRALKKGPGGEGTSGGYDVSQFEELLGINFDELNPRAQWVAYLHMCFMKSNLWGRALNYLDFALPGNDRVRMYTEQLQNNNPNYAQSGFPTATAPIASGSLTPNTNMALALVDPSASPVTVTGGAARAGVKNLRGNQIVDNQHQNQQNQQKNQQNQHIPEMPKHAILPIYRQFWEVTRRSAHLYTRSSSLFYTRLWSSFLLSLFFGVFYLKIKVDSTSQLIRFMAASIISIGNTTYIMATTSLPVYVSLRPVWAREIFSNYYYPWLWPISFMINEFLWAFPISVFCFIPNYFLIGASSDPAVFFSYWLVVIVLIIMFTQFTLALSMLLPRAYTEVVQNVYVSLCFSFGNIAMTYPNTNSIYKVIMRILPFYYSNRAITTQQFKHDTTPIEVFIDDKALTMPLNEWIKIFTGYHMDDNVYWWSILWLVVTIFTFATVSLGSSLLFQSRRR